MSDNLIPERVYIRYSVDFREVPDKVRDLMRELSNTFSTMQSHASKTAMKVSENPVYGLDDIKALEELTNKISTRLKESAQILSNYIDIIVAASEARAASAKESNPEPEFVGVKKVTTIVKGV